MEWGDGIYVHTISIYVHIIINYSSSFIIGGCRGSVATIACIIIVPDTLRLLVLCWVIILYPYI